jgi:transposase
MKIATVGLDLAKALFQVHGVDSQGHIVVRRQLRRADVLVLEFRISARQRS